MDQPGLEATLADLNLPAIRFFDSIGFGLMMEHPIAPWL
jgi:hypothetical protein